MLSPINLVRKVDLFTLKLFLTTVEEGQIGRAAALENIAASAATRRLQELEEVAGVALLSRHPKGVMPTRAGVVFARHIHELLGGLEDMRREISEFTEGVRGQLRIAAIGSIIFHSLAREIAEFKRNFPLVDVELVDETNPNVIKALTSGDVDIAVFLATDEILAKVGESFEYRVDRLVVLAPPGHPLSEKRVATLTDILDSQLIALVPSSTMVATLRSLAKAAGRELTPKYNVNSVEVALSLVRAGLGITIQPEFMLFRGDQHEFVAVPIADSWAHRRVCVGMQRGKTPDAAARAFLKQLSSQPVNSTESF